MQRRDPNGRSLAASSPSPSLQLTATSPDETVSLSSQTVTSAPQGSVVSAHNQGGRRQEPPPPGDTGTHWAGPCEYLLQAATRANVILTRRHPLLENPETLAVQLQRYVHYEGTRPPNRQIIVHLRLLTFYPPVPDILPELVQLVSFENPLICRLAHYHIRQAAPIRDVNLYRDLVETLEREVVRPSPARRAAATKTLAKVFVLTDVSHTIDFVSDVFKCIGGARVKDPNTIVQKRKVAGIAIPGTDISDKTSQSSDVDKSTAAGASGVKKKSSLKPFARQQIVLGVVEGEEKRVKHLDDGAGGVTMASRGNAEFVKSRFGKMLVSHSVFAALRRINRVASNSCRVEAYFFNSGLMSAVPSAVRHCMALLEIRSERSPEQVASYLVPRLPHKNPSENRKLQLEDLGAKVYFARLLGSLAEDPNLAAHIPERSAKKSRRSTQRRQRGGRRSEGLSSRGAGRNGTGEGVVEKASNLFKFLFNKDRVTEISATVKATSANFMPVSSNVDKKVVDSRGVEFAEALVNLMKNPSNRVLIESLRGLSFRRWTTWCEAPVPQSALYNSPELADPTTVENSSRWGIGDDEDEESSGDEDAKMDYDDEPASSEPSATMADESGNDAADPDLIDKDAKEKQSWLKKVQDNRKQRHVARIQSSTPFYLRRLGEGVVPALEVVLRRLYAAMVHDETVRRFAAVDAVIVLARAKLYGHSQSDQEQLRRAQLAALARYSSVKHAGERGKALALSRADQQYYQETAMKGEDHPFDPLLAPLLDLMNDDPNQFVRGRAAIALAFVLASGAGRRAAQDTDDRPSRSSFEDDFPRSRRENQSTWGLTQYFGRFVTQDSVGHGTGMRLVSDVVDYLIYELLDLAPDMAASAVELGELWATTHPTIGVCGRLGALWEKVLALGGGQVVGESIFRAMTAKPHGERLASAAATFLRRRTLDLAVITVGTNSVTGYAVPEPLPRPVMIEMEKYFSLLWHSALLGPSAECRTLCIEAMGGAATLAGDPLRVCVYERLVELVRVRGLGLKIPAENVLDALDVLYFSRERFSEARHNNGIARNGTNRSSAWLQIVWRLAAEASSAAQVLLGVPPPTGWLPLGPGAAADVANAEARFGDVRDRHDFGKLKDSRVARQAAPGEGSSLLLPDEEELSESDYSADPGDRHDVTELSENSMFHSQYNHGNEYSSDEDRLSLGRQQNDSAGGRFERRAVDYNSQRRSRDDGSYRTSTSRDESDFEERSYGETNGSDRRGNINHLHERDGLQSGSSKGREPSKLLNNIRRRASDAITGKEPAERDRHGSKRDSDAERPKKGKQPFGEDSLLHVASYAPASAAKLLKGGLRSGGNVAAKAGQFAKSFTGRKAGPS